MPDALEPDPPSAEASVAGDEIEDGPPEREVSGGRFLPATVGGWLYLLVLAGTVVGVALVSTGPWRVGVRWIGGALLLAAGSRLVLRGPQAGMLAVRHPLVDATLLAGLGTALLVLATSIPDQPD